MKSIARPRVAFSLLVAAAAAVTLGAAGCGGVGDQSGRLSGSIKNDGAKQLQSNLNGSAIGGAGSTVKIDDANCVETGSTQNYTCIAHYTVNAPGAGLNNQK